MKRSKAVIIYNEESEKKDKLKVISNTFYRMNMSLEVLVNRTAKEIQDVVEELTQMDEDEILDIIFVIHAKQVNESDRKFSTVDRKILDLYDNIINYLLEVDGFEDKQKIIIFNVSGHDNQADLIPYSPEKEFQCTSYGSNTYIVLSHEENFIEAIFPELGRHRNLSRAIRNNKHLFEMEMLSFSGDLKLEVPPSTTETTSEFHEFIIG